MATKNPAFNLVFMFGPPLLNKVSYLPKSLLGQDYVHLSLRCLFGENPSFGLRDVSLQIIAELKREKQVIIEDELHLVSTRKSILSTVKKKVSDCRALLVNIVPEHGLLQVLWGHQNYHGRGLLSNCSCQNDNVNAERWFDHSLMSVDYLSGFVDAPSENEGFKVEEVRAPFHIESSFKCEVPALFIQWEVAVSDVDDSNTALANVCRKWTALNEHGRIILISDGKKDFKAVSKDTSTIHQYLKQLSIKIGQPVFIVKATNALHANSFCAPPQPGLVAFIQTRYFIDLQHSAYIFETTDHMKMAQAAGVRFVKSCKVFFRYPEKALSSLCAVPPVPPMLRDMPEVKGEISTSETAFLPLLDKCVDGDRGFASQSHSNGLEEFVFVPDVKNIGSLQDSFTSLMTPANEPGSRMASGSREASTSGSVSCTGKAKDRPAEYKRDGSNPKLPVWMTARRLSRKSTESSISGVESDEPDSSFKFSKTVYLMSEKELKEMAIQIMKQAGKTVQDETIQQAVDDINHPG